MSAIGTNALLGFIMAITLVFTMGDIDSMLVFSAYVLLRLNECLNSLGHCFRLAWNLSKFWDPAVFHF